MGKQLMDIILPRLAKRLHGQVERYRNGKMNDEEFANNFASTLQRQYSWLAKRGVSETDAALTIHGAVLVLSRPGLRASAEEMGLPLETIEARAVRAAAKDMAENYQLEEAWAFDVLAESVAHYSE